MDDDDRMDSEIAQLNERLTLLETEFVVQAEVASVERASYATKEDISRIEAQLANCATKQDVARIDASLAAARADTARIEASLMETKIDVARIDAVLDGIQKNYATKADLLGLETRMEQQLGRMGQQIAQMGVQIAQMGTQIAQMGAELVAHSAQMDARMEKINARTAQMESRLARWMLGTMITVIGIACTVTVTVVKLMP